ncbi:MAG: hypothetical protein WBN23_16125, partial [Woeseia sp.]
GRPGRLTVVPALCVSRQLDERNALLPIEVPEQTVATALSRAGNAQDQSLKTITCVVSALLRYRSASRY